MALPKTIYVYEVKDGDDTYLAACYELENISDDEAGSLIGTYELKSKGKFNVEKKLSIK